MPNPVSSEPAEKPSDASASAKNATFLTRTPTTGEYLHVAKLTGLISGLVLAIYVAFRTVSFALDVFMIGFLGILFAIFLASLSRLLGRFTGIAYRWNLAIISFLLFTTLLMFAIFFGSVVYEQVQKGIEQFEAGGAKLVALADQHPPLRAVVDAVPILQSFRPEPPAAQQRTDAQNGQTLRRASPGAQSQQVDAEGGLGVQSGGAAQPVRADVESAPRDVESAPTAGEAAPSAGGRPTANDSRRPLQEGDAQPSNADRQNDEQASDQHQSSDASKMAMTVTREVGALAGRFFVTTFGLLTNFVLIVIVGLYLAASPHAYQRAPSYLFPPRVRPDVTRILDITGETLWRWLLGRLFSMSVSGVGTAVFLYFFGVPSALLIGGLTFLLGFIPNLGPLLAMAVAMLFVIPQGATAVLTVVCVLAFFELLESYLVAPLVTEHQVSLPPALVIFFQALMGIALGFIGLTIAAPLLAVARVLFTEVYRKKVLDEPDAGMKLNDDVPQPATT